MNIGLYVCFLNRMNCIIGKGLRDVNVGYQGVDAGEFTS